MNKLKVANRLFIVSTSALLLFLVSYKGAVKQLKPKLFEPENVSTQLVEYAPTFSVSGNEVYFTRSTSKWGTRNMKNAIYHSVKENSKWSTPKLASFSGKYDDSAPHLTSDGQTIYFISKRPLNEGTQSSKDIWRVTKDKNNQWGTPIRLSDSINSEKSEYSPCTDVHGNLYFASNRSGGYGQGDLYMAKKRNETFDVPINLGNTINSEQGEWNLEVNRSGDVIIFESSGRTENLSPYGDLYVSYKLGKKWTIPQAIKEVNTTGSDLYAELTEADTLLYFTSSDSLRSTDTNIYFIPFETISNSYREKARLSKQ
ncbi:hypothetical protein [uncultured Psychroserpens sp.]|uniref:TolB family protein n=1 Tax=uncultured Psychroserpens sp. TaxID=255436 RepID=UPI0026188C76|nr:hypothetical protein [uncultured Psychroserpens sp.]